LACRHLGNVLPGSSVALVNYDLPQQTINASFAPDMDPRFISSYEDYYVSVNPWLDFWESAPAGIVLSSEGCLPSSSFRDSEFYVEWLAPQQNMEAAIGLRLDVHAQAMIHTALHYGLASASVYEALATA